MTIPAKEEDRSAQDWGGRARAANDGTRSNWRKLTMRRAQADMPGRGKAIRRLVELGLKNGRRRYLGQTLSGRVL
jgi:hypothetical protein